MQTIKLNLGKRSYNIIAGSGIINNLGKYVSKLDIGKDAYVITNSLIKKRFERPIRTALLRADFSIRFKTIPDTEKSKSIETAYSVINDISRYDKGRRIFIIAFGGGVIGDVSGFIASIYKRGIPYIQIPTTLLAQVDSSIGGKTAVDLPQAKNLIGAFYQPKLVFSDIGFLKTLDKRQLRSGLAEVIKYGVIKDAQLFSFLERNYKDIFHYNAPALVYIVKRSSEIKAGIVSRDEKEEKGIRTILNFGHTAGHAIEAACGYKTYNHGEAIGLGMIMASDIAQKLGLIDKKTFNRIENLIKKIGLPVKIKKASLSAIINAHYRDKKFIGRKNRIVLINGIGKAKIVENIPLELIKEAIKNRF